jgi:hypothetical protein
VRIGDLFNLGDGDEILFIVRNLLNVGVEDGFLVATTMRSFPVPEMCSRSGR